MPSISLTVFRKGELIRIRRNSINIASEETGKAFFLHDLLSQTRRIEMMIKNYCNPDNFFEKRMTG